MIDTTIFKIRQWISSLLFMVGIGFITLAGIINPMTFEDLGIERDEFEKEVESILGSQQMK